MRTDGFSPSVVAAGATRAILDLLVARTSFRIRVLTKKAVGGSREWVEFFRRYRHRFVVGLSTGSLDREWAQAVEVGTSTPAARLHALRAIQDAGVSTYGMMCPVFPDVMHGQGLDDLGDAIRPALTKTVWAGPYSDRQNWRDVTREAAHARGCREEAPHIRGREQGAGARNCDALTV